MEDETAALGAEGFTEWLRARIQPHVRGPVPLDTAFLEHGIDSVVALTLLGEIDETFGLLLSPADLYECSTVRELGRRLAARHGAGPQHPPGRTRTAFVFTGQGSQHPGMTLGLYRNSTAFRGHLTEAAELLAPHLGLCLTDLLLAEDPRIHETSLTQPALLAVEYALAAALLEEGVRPQAVLGHGIGEFAAAVVGGALGLAEAAELVARRGAVLQELPSGGGMMATCADPYEAAEATAAEPWVSIAAFNAAKATVLSGDLGGLERVGQLLGERGISSTFLQVTHAFHSPLMAPAVPLVEEAARDLAGGESRTPFYSTVYGRRYDRALDAEYWAGQVVSPVRFSDAVRRLYGEHAPTHVVEIGPKAVLAPFLRRIGGRDGPKVLPVCRGPESNAVHLAGVLSALSAGPLAEEPV